jgi:fructose-1-phosphate kinase PfkB-like protein
VGAVGVDRTGQVFGWTAPQVAAVSPVGSGDSTFAGIAAGLARGQSLSEATRLGVAAGAANTLRVGAGRFDREQVERLLSRVEPLASLAGQRAEKDAE